MTNDQLARPNPPTGGVGGRSTTDDITIDASGRILGRLASEIAVLLRGKDDPNFAPNKYPKRRIIVTNLNKVRVTGKKVKQKLYKTHSGYLGHLKEISYENMFERNPKRVLEWAIYGMLPKNRLRSRMMQNLEISLNDHDAK